MLKGVYHFRNWRKITLGKVPISRQIIYLLIFFYTEEMEVDSNS